MLISIYIPAEFMKESRNADPARLSAQVISGIGFLGAGAIFRYGFSVKGLTTAASIWTVSAIGLAIGAGFYFLGLASTALLVVILQLFDRVENRFFERKDMRVLTVVINSAQLGPKQVIDTVKGFDIILNRSPSPRTWRPRARSRHQLPRRRGREHPPAFRRDQETRQYKNAQDRVRRGLSR